MHGVKTAHPRDRHGRFTPAGYDDIALPQADRIHGIDQGVGRTGTSGDRGIIRSHEPVFDRNVAWCDIRDHFRDEEGIEPRSSVTCSKIQYFGLESLEAADTGSPNDSDPEFINGLQVQPGVCDGFV